MVGQQQQTCKTWMKQTYIFIIFLLEWWYKTKWKNPNKSMLGQCQWSYVEMLSWTKYAFYCIDFPCWLIQLFPGLNNVSEGAGWKWLVQQQNAGVFLIPFSIWKPLLLTWFLQLTDIRPKMQNRLWPMKLMRWCIYWIFSATQMTWLTVAAGSSEEQTRSGAAVLWWLLLLLWFLWPASAPDLEQNLYQHLQWSVQSQNFSVFRSGVKILLLLLLFIL